ncbi:MAG: ribbon-helix-helix protein, CopG family [Actinomycetales bacterium]|nr:ribbon-helix-helix protein, CopG family [Actinomycetales bacterium]
MRTTRCEAEAGFDDSHIRDGGRGRPSPGTEPARTVHVKVDQPLYQALAQRAEAESVSVSLVIRRALRRYLLA